MVRTQTTPVVALFCALRSPLVTKVAIVDDHEALREGLTHLLEDRGVEVVGTAGTAAAAADVLERGEPDVAVIDIRLPDESGIELTRAEVPGYWEHRGYPLDGTIGS